MVQSYSDYIYLINLYCLPGLGCYFSRAKLFQAYGVLVYPPEVLTSCKTACYLCNGCDNGFLQQYSVVWWPTHISQCSPVSGKMNVGNCDEVINN